MPSAPTVPTSASKFARPPRPRPVLRVLHGPGSARPPALELGEAVVDIGREVEGPSALRLDDASVSRLHARIAYVPALDAHVLTDCASSNGVFVNGRQVGGSRGIEVGDVIRLGESVLVVAERVAEPDADLDPLGLLGDSAAMTALRTRIRRVAPTALPVLISGATGTGKELVARALHRGSGRTGRFVAVNCAALAATLVEDALFGHRRGAFTGAVGDEPGAFVLAHQGTLFLDEIGDMPVEAQPKLLRALENGEVSPLGTSTSRQVDVRVVAATHVELAPAIAAGRFRDDLFARLAGVTITTPRLADRREDLLTLWQASVSPAALPTALTADLVEALACYPWPRNVRELRRLAERFVVLAPDRTGWQLADLDAELAADFARRRQPGDPAAAAAADATPAAEPPPPPAKAPLARAELLALLDELDGSVAELARRVGRNRKQIYRWMDQYGIARGTGRRG